MKNGGFRNAGLALIIFAFLGCEDDPVPCDMSTFIPWCDGNVQVFCGSDLDEENYSNSTTIRRYQCPVEQPYCVTTELMGVCSLFESDRGYCGAYASLGRYCEEHVFTECGGLAIKSQYTCADGTFCGHYGCEPLPEVRDAELWQGCDEACGEKICWNIDIMGPYAEAPELPIEVWVGGATGYFDMEDGSKVYFEGCERPLRWPEAPVAQHCFCYDPP